jgi:hypothetical protein
MSIPHLGAAAHAFPDLALLPAPAPLPPPPRLRAVAASHSRHPSSFPTADGGKATLAAGSRGRTPAASPSPAHRGDRACSSCHRERRNRSLGATPSCPPTGIPPRVSAASSFKLLCVNEPRFVQATSKCCT